MTYRVTLTLPDADPIVEEGETPLVHPAAATKILVTDVLARHPAAPWTAVTVVLTR
jgi:hypothetical protein